MSRLKVPGLSLGARGTFGKALSFVKRRGQNLVEKKPEITDAKTAAQLSWRHMYQKCAALWHTLSESEQADWNSLGGIRHMTGFAYWQSQCLRPNPGIYLPLQGGTMQGIIDMDGYQIEAVKDPVVGQDGDTKAARDAAIAAAIGGSLTCDIYGFDGMNWQKLLVQSAAHHNLRVALFEGAFRIYSLVGGATIPHADRGLFTHSAGYGTTGVSWHAFRMAPSSTDAVSAGTDRLLVNSSLYGYNGADWDRLRSYDTGILKVAKGAIGPARAKMTGTGQVGAAGVRKLFWIACSPDGPAAEWELTDADAGGGAVVYDHFDADKHSEQIDFDPPMEFATGIWVEKFDHMKSLVFCYK